MSEIDKLKHDVKHKKLAVRNRKVTIKELKKDKDMLKSDLNNAYITVGKQSREIERQADVIKELEDHVRELESGVCSCCAEVWKNKKIVELNKENIILKERDTKARKILKPILNEWKETRWILQSTKSVENIAELMADAEIFLGEVEE